MPKNTPKGIRSGNFIFKRVPSLDFFVGRSATYYREIITPSGEKQIKGPYQGRIESISGGSEHVHVKLYVNFASGWTQEEIRASPASARSAYVFTIWARSLQEAMDNELSHFCLYEIDVEPIVPEKNEGNKNRFSRIVDFW